MSAGARRREWPLVVLLFECDDVILLNEQGEALLLRTDGESRAADVTVGDCGTGWELLAGEGDDVIALW